MLCLVLCSSGQERYGAPGAGTVEVTKMMKGLEHFSYEYRLRELFRLKR